MLRFWCALKWPVSGTPMNAYLPKQAEFKSHKRFPEKALQSYCSQCGSFIIRIIWITALKVERVVFCDLSNFSISSLTLNSSSLQNANNLVGRNSFFFIDILLRRANLRKRRIHRQITLYEFLRWFTSKKTRNLDNVLRKAHLRYWWFKPIAHYSSVFFLESYSMKSFQSFLILLFNELCFEILSYHEIMLWRYSAQSLCQMLPLSTGKSFFEVRW